MGVISERVELLPTEFAGLAELRELLKDVGASEEGLELGDVRGQEWESLVGYFFQEGGVI